MNGDVIGGVGGPHINQAIEHGAWVGFHSVPKLCQYCFLPFRISTFRLWMAIATFFGVRR